MSAIENLTPQQQDVVRTQVQALLKRTDTFKDLDLAQRRKMADGLTDVVAFLADPAAGQPGLAQALAERKEKTGAEKVQDRLARKESVVGKDFDAGAMRAGTQAFKELVQAVDFPKFVSGLIEGVFTSIVDSSIRQMNAYGKLLEGVVKSVDQFAAENITQNQARDYMRNRFPDAFDMKVEAGSPRLIMKDSAPDDALEKVKKEMGVQASINLDDEAGEAGLLQRAQLEMARSRQQLLATMVLLGINRIVVTDGLINAKVIFDVKASDVAQRQARASMYDDVDTKRQSGDSGGWFSDSYDNTQEEHRTVVSSAVDDTSESKAQMKANLTGEVRVNFKSETFPLDQMASAVQIQSVNDRAKK